MHTPKEQTETAFAQDHTNPAHVCAKTHMAHAQLLQLPSSCPHDSCSHCHVSSAKFCTPPLSTHIRH
jgi:hypothetical protein